MCVCVDSLAPSRSLSPYLSLTPISSSQPYHQMNRLCLPPSLPRASVQVFPSLSPSLPPSFSLFLSLSLSLCNKQYHDLAPNGAKSDPKSLILNPIPLNPKPNADGSTSTPKREQHTVSEDSKQKQTPSFASPPKANTDFIHVIPHPHPTPLHIASRNPCWRDVTNHFGGTKSWL
jgi:hypothetical protein